MTDKQRNRLNGILGTVAFHLLLILFFLAIRLKGYEVPEKDSILIDFQEVENQVEQLQKQQEEVLRQIETPDLSNQAKSNIAVNVTKDVQQELSTEQYVEDLMKELDIESLETPEPTEIEESDAASLSAEEQHPPATSDEKGEYSGETKIKYALKDRQKVYIPVPSFKCLNSGIIVIDITVNPEGEVIQTSLSPESSTSDECLVSEALQAARGSYFNRSEKAPNRQKGYISFEFRAQQQY
ncbi:MAG: hypothetical protein GVY19_04285 [Bacteroidetes bacterium]|nr:hypothetical protein [Bacteroidota bacterium]